MEEAPKTPEEKEREAALQRARETFEEVRRDMGMRTGDPEKLQQSKEKMRKLYPKGHDVPERVGQPFRHVGKEDELHDAAN